MKNGKIGCLPLDVERYMEDKIYTQFEPNVVSDAKGRMYDQLISLKEANEELYNFISLCLIELYGSDEVEFDEDDVIMNIATRKVNLNAWFNSNR